MPSGKLFIPDALRNLKMPAAVLNSFRNSILHRGGARGWNGTATCSSLWPWWIRQQMDRFHGMAGAVSLSLC